MHRSAYTVSFSTHEATQDEHWRASKEKQMQAWEGAGKKQGGRRRVLIPARYRTAGKCRAGQGNARKGRGEQEGKGGERWVSQGREG